jgi:Zn-dependent peptidase ImmA (M78 family)
MERVQDAAAEANVPRDTVLAYAIAHEIGHLLLGDNAHTPRGVMKGNWDRKDYEAMNQRQFHFIEGQAHQLASRFGGAPSAQVAVGQ